MAIRAPDGAKKVVEETKMDAYSTKDDQHSRNDKSVVIELILNISTMSSSHSVSSYVVAVRCAFS